MMRNLVNMTKYFPKKFVVIAALAFGLILPGAVFAGWAPERPVFDWNNPADRQGSMNGVVFNSFINTEVYGDERDFFTANEVDVRDNGQNNVTVRPGQEFVLQAYVHNNANESTNASGTGKATNTKVRFDIPTAKSTNLRAIGYISTDASKVAAGHPSLVSDTIDFRADTPFALDYIEGSAKFYNNRGVHTLPDSIVDGVGGNTGTLIGFETMDSGEVPGCFEYDGWAVVKVRVIAPELKVSKQVKIEGSSTWKESVEAKPGDEVAWIVGIDNTGTDQAVDVTVHDILPPNLKVKPGSVKVFNSTNPSGKVIGDGNIFGSSRSNIGEINAGANAFVRFTTIVQSDFKPCTVTHTNVVAVNSDNTGEKTDNAQVKITKPNCVEVAEAFTCQALTATPATGNAPLAVKLKAVANTTGVTVQEYRFDFDNDGIVDRIIKSNQNSIETDFTYTKDATTSVQIVTTSGTTEKVQRCQVNIDIVEAGAPASLPKTGPAETALAMLGSGALAQGVRAWFISRKAFKAALLK